jgi:hypothetical protein
VSWREGAQTEVAVLFPLIQESARTQKNLAAMELAGGNVRVQFLPWKVNPCFPGQVDNDFVKTV